MSNEFDRRRLSFRPVREREHRFRIDEIRVDAASPLPDVEPAIETAIERTAGEVRAARARGAPVVIAFGAHLVKNGLGPLLAELVRDGWITHAATNGAGSIHDWEFAHLGESCEDVRQYVTVGEFGLWRETGFHLGAALVVGALRGWGYGRAVGELIAADGIDVPQVRELESLVEAGRRGEDRERAAAALDVLDAIEQEDLTPGRIAVEHPSRESSIQWAAVRADVPFTVHPGIGQDIIYTHPLVRGGALGRAALRDFLSFAGSVENLEGGVYISAGSSVMSPMIFEKSLSMARNVRLARGERLDDFSIVVNDLAESTWDWEKGEPPPENPAYYVRFCKSFARMGGRMRYVGVDNRVFLQHLMRFLRD